MLWKTSNIHAANTRHKNQHDFLIEIHETEKIVQIEIKLKNAFFS